MKEFDVMKKDVYVAAIKEYGNALKNMKEFDDKCENMNLHQSLMAIRCEDSRTFDDVKCTENKVKDLFSEIESFDILTDILLSNINDAFTSAMIIHYIEKYQLQNKTILATIEYLAPKITDSIK